MYGSIMRARVKQGKREEFERVMRELTPAHQEFERGLHSIELAWEDSDPNRVVMIIHFRDRESYVRNANLPQTDADYRRWVKLLEEEPEWTDVFFGNYLGKPLTSTASASGQQSSGAEGHDLSVTETLKQAIKGFQKRVQAVGDDQWNSPTPCTEWDVRALVNHVVGELRWIPPLLAGRTIAEVGDQFAGDLLGNQPKPAWAVASQQAIEASLQPGTMERTVHLSSGDRRADAYISEVATDLVIHTWDLARGIGADDRLDRELVDFAQATLKPQVEAWRAAGAFAPAVNVPQGADVQTQFLALVGRRRTG